jgi:adenylosuccinate lyase
VLDEFGSFPAVIEKELLEELPYLSTTRLLMAAVQKGIGRETAHEIISEHARKSSMSRREGLDNKSFVELLDSDDRFPLKEEEINELFSQREILIGNASNQVQSVIEKIAEIVTHRPLAASYKPEPLI